jgi:hypothetical protein
MNSSKRCAPARTEELLQAGHVVQFYRSDEFIVGTVSRRTAQALRAGTPCILVATRSHLERIQHRLRELGFPLDELRMRGHYTALDAAETLRAFMDHLLPDKRKFDRVIGAAIHKAAALSSTGVVSVFGEMVALLCYAGNSAGAIRLEELWNVLVTERSLALCCAYPLEVFMGDCRDAVFGICEQHSVCLPAENPL